MKFLKKPYRFAFCFTFLLILYAVYCILDVFVIPHKMAVVVVPTPTTTTPAVTVDAECTPVPTVITDSSYTDANIAIYITTTTYEDSTAYVADITLSSSTYLKTALAQNAYGVNVRDKTSVTAETNNAILAINGDYYGANEKGYVIKNGVCYRSTVRDNYGYDDLVIYNDGSFGIINEKEVSTDELLESGVRDLLAFGPCLVADSKNVVSDYPNDSIVKYSHPRTCIGIIDDCHYLIVVVDGRTKESSGLSLSDLADLMLSHGCTIAYNLDGGGSSTLYFNGSIINKPTTDGKEFKERRVSDIVYIGY